MSSDDVNSVVEQFSKATSLGKSELSFAGKGLKLDTEKDAQEVAEAISSAGSMQVLRLEGNTLGVDAAKAIAAALEKHPEFERAKWSDMFTGRLKSEIPHALRHLGNAMMASGARLVELDLSDNAFGPNGMDGLMNFLTSSSCYTLQELRLNNNGLGVTGGKMLAKCLTECHKKSSAAGTPLALRVFVSGRGRLENEGSIALAGAFKAMGSLEEVQMPQNGITHHGITALAEALAENKNLRIVNLNDNTFTEKGASAMAEALPHMTKLEVLNFGDCLLRSGGAKAIAEAIKDGHTTLKTVNLSFNEIGADGGKAIAEAMENKTNLDVLELDGNQFGEAGVELVRATMEAMGSLDLLGSLSEDEGADEDDEDEDEDEEVPEEDEDGDEIDDPNLMVNGVALTPRGEEQKPVTASEFLQFPSPRKLKQIGSNRASLIVEQLGTDIQDVEKAVKAFMKVSSVVTPDDDEVRNIACECADAVFTGLVKDGSSNLCCMISNTLLVHLGLLKGEEKVNPPSNIAGPLLVLEHVVQQNYFPKSARGILQVFVSRPHPLLEASEKSRHQLLQTLYKF